MTILFRLTYPGSVLYSLPLVSILALGACSGSPESDAPAAEPAASLPDPDSRVDAGGEEGRSPTPPGDAGGDPCAAWGVVKGSNGGLKVDGGALRLTARGTDDVQSGIQWMKKTGTGDFTIDVDYRDYVATAAEGEPAGFAVLSLVVSSTPPDTKGGATAAGNAAVAILLGPQLPVPTVWRALSTDGSWSPTETAVPSATSGTLKMARSGGTLTIGVETGGQSYPLSANVPSVDQYVSIALSKGTPEFLDASVTIDRVAIAIPQQGTTFVDDFACDSVVR